MKREKLNTHKNRLAFRNENELLMVVVIGKVKCSGIRTLMSLEGSV